MTKRSNPVAILAILAVSLLAGANGASAQTNFSPARVITVQSNACSCRDDCFNIDCSDFCAFSCQGACARRFQNARNACLRRCGRCRFPQ